MNNILPDHPDNGPRIDLNLLNEIQNALKSGEAKELGESEHEKDCYFVIVKFDKRYFLFLDEVSEYGWEVSENGANNYLDIKY